MTDIEIKSMITNLNRIYEKLIKSDNLESFKSRSSNTITIDSVSDQIRYFHDKFKSNYKNNCVGTIYRSRNVTNIDLGTLPPNNNLIHCEHTLPINNLRAAIFNLYKKNPNRTKLGKFMFLTHMPTCIKKTEINMIKDGMKNSNPEFKNLLLDGNLTESSFGKINLFSRYRQDLEIVRVTDGVVINKESYSINDHIEFIENLFKENLELFVNRLNKL
jgi:hypothetical protein